jgi:hypothetical protein
LKKGEIEGFALTRLAEIPPAPLYERGEILFTDNLLINLEAAIPGGSGSLILKR